MKADAINDSRLTRPLWEDVIGYLASAVLGIIAGIFISTGIFL